MVSYFNSLAFLVFSMTWRGRAALLDPSVDDHSKRMTDHLPESRLDLSIRATTLTVPLFRNEHDFPSSLL